MLESNPPRNSQLETHPDDELPGVVERVAPGSFGKISRCLKKLMKAAAQLPS